MTGLGNMHYFRLRDIKTPPFAYVTNKEEAIDSCPLCHMPFSEPRTSLEIEIFTTDSEVWESRIEGRPMMADLWLIGDNTFAAMLEQHMPGMFKKSPVEIVSWMTRSPGLLVTDPADFLKHKQHSGKPYYYRFSPVQSICLDAGLRDLFPAIRCNTCDREMPEIPIEYQRMPDISGELPAVASLEGFCLEGYDYLFDQACKSILEKLFPEMMMEPLVSEPLPI